MFGWSDFTIIGSASVSAIAYIFAQTVNTLIPIPNPFENLSHLTLGNVVYPFADSGIKILAIVTIMILTWINCRGRKESGKLNNAFTITKVLA